MESLSALFHQNPIPCVVFGIGALAFFWGALGTSQRRRNLKQAFFGTGFSAKNIIGEQRMATLMQELAPIMDEVRALQKKCRRITVFIFLVVIALLVINTLGLKESVNQYIVFIGLFFLVLPNVLYSYHAKKNILPRLAERMGFRYDGKTRNLFDTLLRDEDALRKNYGGHFGSYNNSILLGSYEKVAVEDGFSSPCIQFQEIHTWLGKQDEDSEGYKDTRFKGLLVRITMPQPFECAVLLREDMGNVGNKLSFAPKGFERIGLEDPEFESFFEVFAPDQVKARRILTPRFMETIKSVMGYYPSGRVTSLMADNQLYLAIHSHDNLFETGGIFTSLESNKSVWGVITQLELQKRVLQCFIPQNSRLYTGY